tara:strand:+ start:25188 stop:25724 length:537 start_codon:yes stop_codon:yes gene_type:complete
MSVFLLILFLFPILIIALLIILIDWEKPFYFSCRIGKDSKIFHMPKFRTMKSSTPQIATHLLHDPDDHLLLLGKFLRKTSLDELPQLFSIIQGHMTFVGPRPALYNQDDLIALRKHFEIDKILPGVTGWAQVNGRDELSISKKVELDREYLKRKSFLFDIYIIWLTLIKVFRQEDVSH